MPDEYMDTKQVARLLALNPGTLAVWRSRGQGPAFTPVGRAVRYRRSDVAAWIEARRVVPGGDA